MHPCLLMITAQESLSNELKSLNSSSEADEWPGQLPGLLCHTEAEHRCSVTSLLVNKDENGTNYVLMIPLSVLEEWMSESSVVML